MTRYYVEFEDHWKNKGRDCHLCGAECGAGSDYGICVDCRDTDHFYRVHQGVE